MELDELQKIWKHQKTEREIKYSRKELLLLINNKMPSFDKDIESRDRRELIACAFVAVAFGVLFFFMASVWSKLGCIIIVLSAVYIAYRLKKAEPQKVDDPNTYNHSIKNHLRQEFENVQQQKNLLKSIVWWYILPICVGLILFTLGINWYLFIKITYIILILLMGAGIWYVNQQAVDKRFNPLLKEIRESIEFIESPQN